jgi:hypothetical protein
MDASRRKMNLLVFGGAGCANLSGLFAGSLPPLALMGVRCLWPHNMIGRGGLVVDQASRLAVFADEPSGFTSHSIAVAVAT